MGWVLAQMGTAGVRGGAPSGIDAVLDWAVTVVGLIGAAVILWGVASSVVRLIPVELRELRGRENIEQENDLRRRMGFHMLLGLEFLVAADIIATLLTPDLQHLMTLGVIVVIRIVVGATLHWELSRRQEHEKQRSEARE